MHVNKGNKGDIWKYFMCGILCDRWKAEAVSLGRAKRLLQELDLGVRGLRSNERNSCVDHFEG